MAITESVLCVFIVGVNSVKPVLVVPLTAPADGGEEPEEAVVEDLRRGHQAEAHAQAQQPPRVGDVRRLCDLLILHEPLGIRVLQNQVLAFACYKFN